MHDDTKKFILNDVVPWGRSFDEYLAMFNLTPDDLQKIILDCGAGPGSFNCKMTQQNLSVISCDPLFDLSRDEIRRKIDETFKTVLDQARLNKEKFSWTAIKSPEDLGRVRMAAMEEFLDDFEKGKGLRYLPDSLPALPFEDRQFDLALSSHFLLLYSDHLSYEFHMQSVYEMCRVAREARIFPIVDLNGARSPHLMKLISNLNEKHYKIHVEKVKYEFQRGANEMLKILPPRS